METAKSSPCSPQSGEEDVVLKRTVPDSRSHTGRARKAPTRLSDEVARSAAMPAGRARVHQSPRLRVPHKGVYEMRAVGCGASDALDSPPEAAARLPPTEKLPHPAVTTVTAITAPLSSEADEPCSGTERCIRSWRCCVTPCLDHLHGQAQEIRKKTSST